jgi:cytoskeleton protein RodZ
MTSESIGPYLKQAREAQGLSLDQVASVTRVQLKYLQAIEDEHFTALPEQVFTKGFVRTYARSLGIDEQDVLQRFTRSWDEYFGRGQREDEHVQSRREEQKPRKSNRTAMVILIGIVVLGIGLYLSREPKQPNPSLNPETLESTSVPSPSLPKNETNPPQLPPIREESAKTERDMEPINGPGVPELPPVALPSVAIKPKPVKTPPPTVTKPSGPLLMELEATQLTWVVVKSDENKPKEALLQPKQRTTWKAKEQFILTLGNAGGVRIWLNGESRGPFGKQGQIVREIVIRN